MVIIIYLCSFTLDTAVYLVYRMSCCIHFALVTCSLCGVFCTFETKHNVYSAKGFALEIYVGCLHKNILAYYKKNILTCCDTTVSLHTYIICVYIYVNKHVTDIKTISIGPKNLQFFSEQCCHKSICRNQAIK